MLVSKLDDFTDHPLVSRWLRNGGKVTYLRYSDYIKQFCSFTKLNPKQIISLAQGDKVSLKEKIVEFYQELVQRGYAPNTCRSTITGIRSFLSYNEIRFEKFPIIIKSDTL